MKKIIVCLLTAVLLAIPTAAEDTANETALTTATVWLEYGGHTASAKALQAYLESCGITGKPMVYAVQHCGEDWYENAARVGASSVDELRALNFTLTQAFYGVGLQDYKGTAADLLSTTSKPKPSTAASKKDSETKETKEDPKPTAHTPTVGEQNALAMAMIYLSMDCGYSESSLKDQLEFEGYTSSECQYAVDNCGADWYEQAEIRAAVYLKTMPFSKDGLIEQLESSIEGFTHDQAVHGASSVFD